MKKLLKILGYTVIGFIILCVAVGGMFILYQNNMATAHVASPEMAKHVPKPWPPQLNQSYPDMELIDQEGKHFNLSDFKGKVIVIEPVGMNCPACQAFSGGNERGAFQGNSVQKNISSFENMLPKYSNGVSLPHKEIIFIQLLLYDMRFDAPTSDHAKIWAEHFHLKKSNNQIVAVSPYDLRNKASWDLVPGFQLIDTEFVLRSDSTGHFPKDNLYKTLMPMVPALLKE